MKKKIEKIGNFLSDVYEYLVIKQDVGIGVGAVILSNFTTRENIIVGSNIVITKDILANCVVAGVPPRTVMNSFLMKFETLRRRRDFEL